MTLDEAAKRMGTDIYQLKEYLVLAAANLNMSNVVSLSQLKKDETITLTSEQVENLGAM